MGRFQKALRSGNRALEKQFTLSFLLQFPQNRVIFAKNNNFKFLNLENAFRLRYKSPEMYLAGFRWNWWRIAVFVCISLAGLNCFGKSKPLNKVLFLGDSQSIGAFGTTLDRSMRNAGLEVYTIVAGGASPYYWLSAYRSIPSSIGYWEKTPVGERRLRYIRAVPKLESLISKHHPDVVVIQTGINLYATLRSRRHSREENRAKVRSLIDQMCAAITKGGASSYWILPPQSHPRKYPKSLQADLRKIMEESVKHFHGEVFRSQDFTEFTDPYPASDGIHFGREDSIQWAKKVAAHFLAYMKTGPSPALTSQISKVLPLQTGSSSTSSLLSRQEHRESPEQNLRSTGFKGNAPVDLVMRLVRKSEIKNPNTAPYDRSLGMFEYEVVKVRNGVYPFDRIRVAHGIMFQRRLTSSARRKIGDSIELTLVPLKKYPNLKRWNMVDQLPQNLALPVYTPKLD